MSPDAELCHMVACLLWGVHCAFTSKSWGTGLAMSVAGSMGYSLILPILMTR